MKVEFYATENGKKPIEDFLSSMNAKMRVKAIWLIDLSWYERSTNKIALFKAS